MAWRSLLAGGAGAFVSHLADTVVDSISVAPAQLILIGATVALLTATVPVRGRVTQAELVELLHFWRQRGAAKMKLPADCRMPGTALVTRHHVALLERLIADRTSVQADDVRGAEEDHATGHEWMMEHHGYDDAAEMRTRTVAALYRLLDEKTDSPGAPSLCPLPPPAQLIKVRRIEHRLSQVALGEMVGVDHTTVSRWERGLQPVSRRHANLLAAHIGGHPSDYLE